MHSNKVLTFKSSATSCFEVQVYTHHLHWFWIAKSIHALLVWGVGLQPSFTMNVNGHEHSGRHIARWISWISSCFSQACKPGLQLRLRSLVPNHYPQRVDKALGTSLAPKCLWGTRCSQTKCWHSKALWPLVSRCKFRPIIYIDFELPRAFIHFWCEV